MEAVRSYLLSVTAVCLISVLACALVRQETVRKIVRFSSGLLILLVVIVPLLSLDMENISDILRYFRVQYDQIDAEETWHEQLSQHIKRTSEAYIEDKAAALGASVRAEVTLSDAEYPAPVHAKLTGIVSPQQRRALAEYMRTALDIAEEEQEWYIYETDG